MAGGSWQTATCLRLTAWAEVISAGAVEGGELCIVIGFSHADKA